MHSVVIPNIIQNMLSLFYRLGIWHHGEATVRQTRTKFFYCIWYLLFPMSLIAGAILTDNQDESIFLVEISIAASVVSIKLWFLVWKKENILELLNRIGVYTVRGHEDLVPVNNTLKKFSRFLTVLFFLFNIAAVSISIILPLFGSERKLFLNIAFPLDWKNSGIAFCIVNMFILSECLLSVIVICFSAIIWYLMLSCALRYEILGNEIRRMGEIRTAEVKAKKNKNKVEISDSEKQAMFLQDLITAIDSHQHIRKLIQELESLLANLFFVQIVTSSLCICGSTYCLGYDFGENLIERILHVISLLYHISEIFMITHLGNEIMDSSDRLSYSLFQSNWVDQPQSTKKCIIIFGELLKQPHQLVIVIYPLTLETFKRILNSAYSMFNILRNLK